MKKSLLLPLSLLLSIYSWSQTNVTADYHNFIEKNRENLILYRGVKAEPYRVPDKGTYYAYSPDFSEGTVIYRDKSYYNLSLNLNSHLDELYIKDNNHVLIVLNKSLVKSFSLANRNFINFLSFEYSIKGLPDNGYYEVLYKGDYMLVKKITKRYSESVVRNISAKSEDGRTFMIERVYEPQSDYFLIDNNRAYRIKKERDLLSHFPDQKREIKSYMRSLDYSTRKEREKLFVMILTMVEFQTK